LTVDFTAVSDQSSALHSLCNITFVNRRLLVNPSGGVTAVVDMSV
jgi:hypothetical protein